MLGLNYKRGFTYFMVRQMIISVILSSITVTVIYQKSDSVNSFVKSSVNLISELTTLATLFAIGGIYVLCLVIKHFVVTTDKTLLTITSYVFEIIKKLANNLESAIQLIVGTIVILNTMWYFIDRQHFNWKLCLFYYAFCLFFITCSALFDMHEHYHNQRPHQPWQAIR